MRPPRRRPLAALPVLVAALALAACGDEGKRGRDDGPVLAPGAGPGATPTSPSAPAAPPLPTTVPPPPPATPTPAPAVPPPPPTALAASAALSPRAGDWVTWTVRAAGVEGATTVTWRAKAVEATRVLVAVASVSTDGAGRSVGSSAQDVWMARAVAPTGLEAAAEGAAVVVGTTTLRPRDVVRGDTTVSFHEGVPLGGVARSRGPGGVEQVVTAFGRGS